MLLLPVNNRPFNRVSSIVFASGTQGGDTRHELLHIVSSANFHALLERIGSLMRLLGLRLLTPGFRLQLFRQ